MKKILSTFIALGFILSLLTMTTNVSAINTTPQVLVQKASAAPTIDGDISEWSGVPKTYFTIYPSTVSTNNYFQSTWDGTYIYLAVEVTDPAASNAGNNDWVRLVFDFDGKATTSGNITTRANAGIYAMNLSPWLPGGYDAPVNYGGSVSSGAAVLKSLTFNSKYENGKVFYEAKCEPTDALKAKLVEEGKIGFAVQYDDNLVGASRDKLYVWGDTDSVLDNDMSTLGEMVLKPTLFQIESGEIVKGTPIVDLKEDLIWKKVPSYDISRVAIIAGWGLGQTTTTGKFKTLWDEKGLYFWIEVTDAARNTTASSGAEMWKLDSVDIFVDQANNDTPALDKPIGGDAGYFSISGVGDYSNPQGGMLSSSTKLMGKTTSTGYVYEGFIKWTKEGIATVDNVIGFDVQINDNNDGITRNAIVSWSQDAGLDFAKVNQYGDLKLVDLGYTEEPIIETPDTSAPANKVSTDILSDGATINWEATTNTDIYLVNLFKVFVSNGNTSYIFVKKYELKSPILNLDISGLDSESKYAYQVIAYDIDGLKLANYNINEFTTLLDNFNYNNDGSNNTNDVTQSTDTNNSPNTSDNNPIELYFLMFICVSIIVIMTTRKSKRNS